MAGGDEAKRSRKRRNSTPPPSSRPSGEDDGGRKKRSKRDEEGRSRRREEKREKKSKKHKSHRSSRSREDKEKSTKDKKHRHSRKLPDTIGVLSESDYFLKNNEFSTWLKEEKGIFFSDLSSSSARELFSGFVKDWNAGRLEAQYYEGIARAPRTAHNWKIKPGK